MPVLHDEHLNSLRNITENDLLQVQLRTFSTYPLTLPSVIKKYHDLLLYYCAFPTNKTTYELAIAELNRIARSVQHIYNGKNTTKQISLMGSGMAHSELLCANSSPVSRWLVKKFPTATEFSGSDASTETVRNIIQALTPAIEYEKSSQGEYSLSARLKHISGLQKPADILKWLLQVFEDSPLPELAKEELYRQLNVFVRWRLDDESFSRTFLRWPVKKTWYHDSFIKNIDSTKAIRQKISGPVSLSLLEKEQLLDVMKASLAFQYRETDPVTYADVNEVELFDMGRGLQIAISGMKKEKRLSLESYVGYMAFKNGIPLSYGGGWMWGQRCKIGVNIYAPFRKGESAWLFCQVLRVYYQHFGARHFIVKPYQFGKGNPEGLKSGAFWFYYKLGFRPATATIEKKAALEWEKINANKTYRTAQKLLRHFTSSSLEWITDKESSPEFDAAEISAAISDMINRDFDSSRKQAVSVLSKKMKKELPILPVGKQEIRQQVIENWSLLTGLISNLPKWNAAQKKKLATLIHLKQTGKERDYIFLLQQHKALWNSLKQHLDKIAQ